MSEQTMDRPAGLTETALELTQRPNSIFRRALFGGYKTQDVDHYVERAADVLESLIDENKRAKVAMDEQKQRETELRTALSSSLRFTDHIVAAAKREASTLLQSTQEREVEYRDQAAVNRPSTLAQEIEALRAQRDRLAAELSASLDSHIRLLTAVETNSMPELQRARVNTLLNGADRAA
jgi:cell division septum initiation protein DivIVA